jgi:hypothetical protein
VVDGEHLAELLHHIDETDVDLSHSGSPARRADPAAVSGVRAVASESFATPSAHLLRVAERPAENRCRP